MRVLFVTGPMEGGMRGHVEALLGGLPAEGVACGMVGPARPATEGVAWTPLALDDRARSALAPGNVRGLRAAWRRGGWELLHAHGYKALALAAATSWITPGLRTVATLHNLCPAVGPAGRLLLRLGAGRVRRVVAVSAAVRESLAAAGAPVRRVVVIPNGIDLGRFAALPEREAARRALGLEEGPVALFAGRLTQEKGVHVLARTAALLEEGGAGWTFLVAGDGPEKATLGHQATRTPSLQLLGHRDDLPRLLAACDVVVVPSLREGQSLVALEAMAAGRPVVASDVGGLGELARLSGAAMTVAPDDPSALAEALERLAAQPLALQELAERGRRYARSHGDWRQMVRRTAALYQEAVARS